MPLNTQSNATLAWSLTKWKSHVANASYEPKFKGLLWVFPAHCTTALQVLILQGVWVEILSTNRLTHSATVDKSITLLVRYFETRNGTKVVTGRAEKKCHLHKKLKLRAKVMIAIAIMAIFQTTFLYCTFINLTLTHAWSLSTFSPRGQWLVIGRATRQCDCYYTLATRIWGMGNPFSHVWRVQWLWLI